METHPVPQNISSYEFRLVGDMTLKQFLQLAGGLVVALLIFRTPLIGIIKYPLVFLSAMCGVAMAFIPINGRPFSNWLGAFVKAIYAPTEYTWIPDPPPVSVSAVKTVTPQPAASATIPATPTAILLSSDTQVKELPLQIENKTLPANLTPKDTQTSFSKISTVPSAQPLPTVTSSQIARPANTPAQKSPPQIPIFKSSPPLPAQTPPDQTPVVTPPAFISNHPPIKNTPPAPAAVVTSLVTPPTAPNVIAGAVVDNQNQPISNATVEIIDTTTSLPSRALRTNRLGQFQIAIPLPSGTYNIIVDKDQYSFKPVSVQVNQNIIPPIIISANHP